MRVNELTKIYDHARHAQNFHFSDDRRPVLTGQCSGSQRRIVRQQRADGTYVRSCAPHNPVLILALRAMVVNSSAYRNMQGTCVPSTLSAGRRARLIMRFLSPTPKVVRQGSIRLQRNERRVIFARMRWYEDAEAGTCYVILPRAADSPVPWCS